MYCQNCGSPVDDNAAFCPNCGAQVGGRGQGGRSQSGQNQGGGYYSPPPPPPESGGNISDKNWIATLLFCIFLGVWGVHRFYVGKPWTAILYILTGGLFGIGVIVDLVMIICDRFTDGNGRIVSIRTAHF